MFIHSMPGVGALALAFALAASPAFAQTPVTAQAQVTDQVRGNVCLRRVAPPSPNPHDVFRRTLCVSAADTDLSAAGPSHRCRDGVGCRKMQPDASISPSRSDQGAA